MATVLGIDAKLYYGVAGSTAATELTLAKDVTLNLEAAEVDVTSRDGSGWRSTMAGLRNASVEFELVWDNEDAGFDAIRAAYTGGTAIALAILDGASGEGLDADFVITAFNRNEPLEEALTVSVTAKPNSALRAPAWQEASAV